MHYNSWLDGSYGMSRKSWPILYGNILYKMNQDFLNCFIQALTHLVSFLPYNLTLVLFVKTLEKVIRLCTVWIFFSVMVVKLGIYYGHFTQHPFFTRIYLSICIGQIKPPPPPPRPPIKTMLNYV